MKEIELPDGSIAEFPDEMSDDNIKQVLRQKFPSAQPQPAQQPAQPYQNPYANYQNVQAPDLSQNPYAIAEAQGRTPETTAGGLLAAAGRGAAPYAAAATLGAAFGGLPGAAAAPTALFAADILPSILNPIAGTNLSTPTETIQYLFTLAGVPIADTEAERIVQTAASGAASTSAFTGLGKTLLGSANPLAQRVGKVLMESPLAQYFGGGLGGGAAQAVAEQGGGAIPQALASLLGGVAGVKTAGRLSRVGTPAMSVAPEAPMNFGNIKFSDFQRLSTSNNPADTKAAGLVIKTVKDAAGDQYQNVLKTWAQSNEPLVEVFKQPVTKLGERAASFPKGEPIARDYFAKQTSQTEEAARTAISENVAPVDNFEEMVKTVVEKGQKEAAPLYEQAYKTTGGKAAFIKPLEKQLVQEGNNIAKLQKELSGLKNEETLVLGRESSQKYNVYSQSNINQQKQALSKKTQELTEKINQATEKKQFLRDFLEESRTDLAAGKQVVWSPNLQRLLNNPEVQKNLRTAYSIEKNNADANFVTFNPEDYGIVGFDAAENPILKKVPNLRMLDMIKKGLDARISSLKDNSGRYTQEGRSVINLKKSFVTEIDNIIEKSDPLGKSNLYAKARQTAGDYLSIEKQMLEGEKFFSTSTGQMKLDLKKMTPREKEAYKRGVASAANKKIEKLIATGQNPYPPIMGTSGNKIRWKQVLTPEEYTNLEKNLKAQDLLYNTKKQIMGGAGKRAQANQDFGGGLEELMTGSGPRSLVIRNIANWLRSRTTGFNDDMAQSVAQILFEENPKQKAIIMKKVFQQNKDFTDRQLENMKDVFLSAEKSLKKIPVSVQVQAIQGPVSQQQEEGQQ